MSHARPRFVHTEQSAGAARPGDRGPSRDHTSILLGVLAVYLASIAGIVLLA